MKKRLLLVIISVLLCVSLVACGSSAKSSERYEVTNSFTEEESVSYWGDGYSDYSEPAMATESKSANADIKETGRKLIKNYNLSVETENMDELIPLIEAEVTRLGGYIENLDTYNGSKYNRSYRYTNYTIRIPANLADEFVEFAGNHGNITNKSLNVNDVTMAYVDTEAQRDSLRIQQERFLELLSQAETVEDILTIEERLTDVRYRLESLESTLRTYDNLVSYSTISVTVSEVVEYTTPEPETYGQRIKESFTTGIKNFVTGLQNFSVWFVGALPVLLLWAVIITLIVLLVKFISKKKKAKKALEKVGTSLKIPEKSEMKKPSEKE